MTTFLYKARDTAGALVSGELAGPTARIVKEALVTRGLLPIQVQPKGFEFTLTSLWGRRVTTKDLVNLTRQFHVMFTAGLSMNRLLAILERQAQHDGLKRALGAIYHDVTSGMHLAEAFARHPRFFNSLYTNMLAIGETAGVLDQTLHEMVEILEKEHRMQAKLRSATLYPKIVLFALVVVATAMLIFVIPVFGDFYAGYGATLPLPTRVLIGISDVLVRFWYVGLLLAGGAAYAWRRGVKSPRGKAWLSRLAFAAPIFGNVNRLIANARFAHLVSALYRAGLPLTQTFDIVADTIDNTEYAKGVRAVRQGIDQGQSMSAAMADAKHFTPMMIEVTSVGEQTGKLDELLESIASLYDQEADGILNNLSTLLEPILLFSLFGMVALLALAVYLPIWNMSKVVMPS